jgi:phosphoglycolate phosphatase-like HAD superfamily hydrolase
MVRKIETIIWDFDGTQGDTRETITQIARELAREYLKVEITPEEIESYRGLEAKQVLKAIFTKACNKKGRPQLLQKLKVQGQILAHFPRILQEGTRKFYEHHEEVKPYEGIVDIIKSLSRKDYENITLSSNEKETIHNIYQGWNLRCVEIYHCATFLGFPSLFGKTDCLKKIIRERGGRSNRYKDYGNPSRAQLGLWSYESNRFLCIADEARDVHAAKKLKVPMFGATWGLNNETALINAGLSKDYIIHEPQEIPEKIEQLEQGKLGQCYRN